MPHSELAPLGRDGLTGLAPSSAKSPAVVWLLSISWAGRTWRWSSYPVHVSDRDGLAYPFDGGLDETQAERALATLSDSPDLLSVSFDLLWPEETDVAELVEQGHDLSAATGELAIHLPGQTWEERAVLLSGKVSQPEYGYAGEPVAFSLVEEPYDDRAVWPDFGARVTRETWPDAHEKDRNKVYPTVINSPGVFLDTSGEISRIPAAPALMVEVDTAGNVDTLLIAGHRVNADTVVVYWRGGTTDGYRPMPVTHQEDGLGRTCAVVDVSGIASAIGAEEWYACWDSSRSHEVFVITWSPGATYSLVIDGTTYSVTAPPVGSTSTVAKQLVAMINADPTLQRTCYAIIGAASNFILYAKPGCTFAMTVSDVKLSNTLLTEGASSGGLAKVNGTGAITGAGDLLAWWLDHSTLRVDRGRFEALRPTLNAYKVSGYCDEEVTPWEWVADNLLPILPVSIHSGPGGLYPVLWRWDATEREGVAHIEEGEGASLESRLSYERKPSELAAEVRLDWAYDIEEGAYRRSTSEAPQVDTDDPESSTSYHSRVASARWGIEGVETLSTDIVYDQATASLVAHHRLAEVAYSPRVVTYSVGQELAWLDLGDVVTLTDQGLHLSNRIALVVGWSLSDLGRVLLDLQLVEDVARSPRSTGPNPTGSDYDDWTLGT